MHEREFLLGERHWLGFGIRKHRFVRLVNLPSFFLHSNVDPIVKRFISRHVEGKKQKKFSRAKGALPNGIKGESK